MNITRIIYTALNTPGFNDRMGIPLNLISGPAAAKTSKVGQLCKKADYDLTTILTALMDPTDAQGLPVPTQDGDHVSTRYAAPAWARALETGKVSRPHVVFLDEISNASGAVQAAFLRVVFEGVVGEIELDPDVRFILAMNPPEQSPNGYPLAPPFANRLCHVECPDPDVSAWGAYMLTQAGTDPAEVARLTGGEGTNEIDTVKVKTSDEVRAEWPGQFQRAMTLVFRFIQTRPDTMRDQPEVHDPRSGHAWASPRTWEMTSRLLAGSWIHGCTGGERLIMAKGCVGEALGSEFMEFALKQDLPDAAEVLKDPANYPIDFNRPDIVVQIVKSVSRHVAPVPAKNRETGENQLVEAKAAVKTEHVDALWTILERVGQVAPHIAMKYYGHLKQVKAYNATGRRLGAEWAAQIKGDA